LGRGDPRRGLGTATRRSRPAPVGGAGGGAAAPDPARLAPPGRAGRADPGAPGPPALHRDRLDGAGLPAGRGDPPSLRRAGRDVSMKVSPSSVHSPVAPLPTPRRQDAGPP